MYQISRMKYLVMLWVSIVSFAQIPVYYSDINFSDSPENVKIALADLITSTHTNITTYTEAWEILKVTDANPENTNEVFLIYGYDNNDGEVDTDLTRYKDNNGGGVGQWNREHVYAKSLATPNYGNYGPGADPHMLRACDVQRNTQRGNYPFSYGEGNSHSIENVAWYPGDQWKGDVARIIMYMYLRYGTQCLPNSIAYQSSNSYHPDMPDIFLTWNVEDPVSELEIQRNNYLETELGNRNPFIDNPYLATLIWGGPEANNTWNLATEDIETENNNLYFAPNPAQNTIKILTSVKRVTILTLEGKKVKSSNLQIIDITDLKPSIYLLQIVTLEGKKVQLKMIKN